MGKWNGYRGECASVSIESIFQNFILGIRFDSVGRQLQSMSRFPLIYVSGLEYLLILASVDGVSVP